MVLVDQHCIFVELISKTIKSLLQTGGLSLLPPEYGQKQ